MSLGTEPTTAEHSNAHQARVGVTSEADIQKRDLALAYIIASLDATCKASDRQLRCPDEAWRTLKEMFQAVSEASVDSKLFQLQAVTLCKGSKIIEFSNRVLELVNELNVRGTKFLL